jgi:hypothetical protein
MSDEDKKDKPKFPDPPQIKLVRESYNPADLFRNDSEDKNFSKDDSPEAEEKSTE